jgi:hypothetical protein
MSLHCSKIILWLLLMVVMLMGHKKNADGPYTMPTKMLILCEDMITGLKDSR